MNLNGVVDYDYDWGGYDGVGLVDVWLVYVG